MNKLLLLIVVAVCLLGTVKADNKKVVCYLATFSVYRPGDGTFEVSDVNPFMCTHLLYAYFGINGDGTVKIIDPYLELEENWGRGNIKKFNELKKINPDLKTIAVVGGFNEGSKTFSIVAANSVLRNTFAKDSAELCLKHGFDGIDLNWEYPGQRDGDPVNDKANYVLLLKEISEEFKKNNLILMASVASPEYSVKISYDVPKISQYLDFINIMAYDLHGSWEQSTALHAPLFAGPNDLTVIEKQLNANASVHFWLSQGAPKEKVILGMPFFGRTFTLENLNQNHIGASAVGPGIAGEFTNEPGKLGYNEVCSQQWTMQYTEVQEGHYAYKGNQWSGHDGISSVLMKTSYALDMNLGGVMVWSLDTDDFRGKCGSGKYPLMRIINTIIGNHNENCL